METLSRMPSDRESVALWVACGRPMQDVSGIERPDMEAARAIQTRRAKQKCRTCGKNHFPFCKPSGKRPPRGGGRSKGDPQKKDKKYQGLICATP